MLYPADVVSCRCYILLLDVFLHCIQNLLFILVLCLDPNKGPSIKYVTLFLVNFDPLPPVTLCHTSRDPPKVRHTSGTPTFSRPSTKIPDKSPLYKFYLNCSMRFLSGGFCPSWFLSVPPSVTIHLLQQKVKHHFKFHVSYV